MDNSKLLEVQNCKRKDKTNRLDTGVGVSYQFGWSVWKVMHRKNEARTYISGHNNTLEKLKAPKKLTNRVKISF